MAGLNNAHNSSSQGFQSLNTSTGAWNGRTLTAGTGINITNADGTGGNPTISSSITGGFTSIAIQTFTGSGTYTPTSGMLYCIIEVLGGGGAGGGATATTSGQYSVGGGGGAGEYARGVFSSGTVGSSQTVTIGAGGTGTSGSTGGTGGTTSVGSLITALGGVGGNSSGSSGSGIVYATSGAGGNGGTGGQFRYQGGSGTVAFGIVGTYAYGGYGGDSMYGHGARIAPNYGSSGGFTGNGYGSGASGGQNSPSNSATTGATGASGLVIITEFI